MTERHPIYTKTQKKEIRQAWRQYQRRRGSTLRLALVAWAASLALLAYGSPWGTILAWPAGFFTLVCLGNVWRERELAREIAAFDADPDPAADPGRADRDQRDGR